MSTMEEDPAAIPIPAPQALEAVRAEVGGWEGVSVGERLFGASDDGVPAVLAGSVMVGFSVGRRSLGHLHGLSDGGAVADLPFPRAEGEELIRAGLARRHAAFPDSGWITAPIRTPAEAAGAVDLFRRSYERALAARKRWSR